MPRSAERLTLANDLRQSAVTAVTEALEDCAEAAVRFALQDDGEALDTLALKVQLEIAHATLQGVVNTLVDARLVSGDQINRAVAAALHQHAAALRRRTGEENESLM